MRRRREVQIQFAILKCRSSWWPVSVQHSRRLRQRILLDRWILRKTNLQPFHIRITMIIVNAVVRHLDCLAYNPSFSGEPSQPSDVQLDLRIRLGGTASSW